MHIFVFKRRADKFPISFLKSQRARCPTPYSPHRPLTSSCRDLKLLGKLPRTTLQCHLVQEPCWKVARTLDAPILGLEGLASKLPTLLVSLSQTKSLRVSGAAPPLQEKTLRASCSHCLQANVEIRRPVDKLPAPRSALWVSRMLRIRNHRLQSCGCRSFLSAV